MRKSSAFSAEIWRLGRNYSGEEGGGEGMGSVQRFQAEREHMRGPRGQQGAGPIVRTQSWCVWLEHRLCELKKKGLKRKAEAISSVVSKSREKDNLRSLRVFEQEDGVMGTLPGCCAGWRL